MYETRAYDPSYTKRKRLVLAGLAIIFVALIIWATLPFAFADENELSFMSQEWYQDHLDNVGDEIADGMYNHIQRIFNTNRFSSADSPTDRLVQNTFRRANTVIGGSEGGWAGTVQNALKGIGFFLVVIYSLVHLIQDIQRGDANLEMWGKLFVTVLIGIILIENFDLVIRFLEGLGSLIATKVGDVVSASDAGEGLRTWLEETFGYSKLIGTYTFDPNWGFLNTGSNLMFMLIQGIKLLGMYILFLAVQIPLLAGDLVLITIWIELWIRKMFFPIALADIAGNGMRSPGVMYMKNFVAVYLRIAMCYVIAAICTTIAGALALQTPGSLPARIVRTGLIFIVYLTAARLYSRTAGLAGQVVGQ